MCIDFLIFDFFLLLIDMIWFFCLDEEERMVLGWGEVLVGFGFDFFGVDVCVFILEWNKF